MFEQLSSVFATNNNVATLLQSLNITISQNLCGQEIEFERYFLEFNGDKMEKSVQIIS